jgi:hypothetical protein
VGGRPATAAAEVWSQLRDFERAAAQGIATLDAAIPLGSAPPDVAALDSVLALAAAFHNEWVRIHPHVNGNGRIARCWANWVLIRYGLPPVVRLRPRPEGALYARAARARPAARPRADAALLPSPCAHRSGRRLELAQGAPWSVRGWPETADTATAPHDLRRGSCDTERLLAGGRFEPSVNELLLAGPQPAS